MITIVNVLVGLGFTGAIVALASLISYTKDIVAELNAVKEDREYWIEKAVEFTDLYIETLDLPEIDNPFAVEHIDGYDVTEAKYVRDANGNWTTTDVHYEKN
jgi:hypothetical protein